MLFLHCIPLFRARELRGQLETMTTRCTDMQRQQQEQEVVYLNQLASLRESVANLERGRAAYSATVNRRLSEAMDVAVRRTKQEMAEKVQVELSSLASHYE